MLLTVVGIVIACTFLLLPSPPPLPSPKTTQKIIGALFSKNRLPIPFLHVHIRLMTMCKVRDPRILRLLMQLNVGKEEATLMQKKMVFGGKYYYSRGALNK